MNEEKTRYLDSDFILAIFWMGRAYTRPPAGSGRGKMLMMMKKHDLFAFTGSCNFLAY